MNCFSRILLVCLLLCGKSALALDLKGLYTSACTREIGVILNVDPINIYFLNIQGNLVSIPRYDVVGLASYPINHIPISKVKLSDSTRISIDSYIVRTNYQNEIIPIIEGWPVGFSKDKIAFLDKDGREVIIQRRNIWEIEAIPTEEESTFANEVVFKYDFIHPVSMSKCPRTLEGSTSELAKKLEVIPQEFVSDPVTIKRGLDKFLDEHKRIKMYVRSQKFYPIPEVYSLDVSLGFWATIASRYGASTNRTNNGAPILVEEFSTGPFGYQHIILTGAAPNNMLIHEEPQTQLFYRFKADYFHAAILLDPNSILVGRKYEWQANDMGNGDLRIVEQFFLEAGLDFGHFSISYVPLANVVFGLRPAKTSKLNEGFYSGFEPLSKYGLAYNSHLFELDVVYGNDIYKPGEVLSIDYKLKLYRLNAEYIGWKKYRIGTSFIHKESHYDTFTADSTTAAVYLDYEINYKYRVKGFASYERYASSDSVEGNYLKSGLAMSLVF